MNYLSSLSLGVAFLFAIASCNNSGSEEQLQPLDVSGLAQVESSPKDPATLLKELEELKELALSNRMIMLTGADFMQVQEKLFKKEKIEADKLLQIKAIIYRFYKNVYVKDGVLYSRAKNGEEIGIREDVFKIYCENLQELSQGIKEIRKTGEYTDEQIEQQLNNISLANMVR